MYDISAANLVSVTVTFPQSSANSGFGGPCVFDAKEFSPDTSPVRVEPRTTVSTKIDMNGNLVKSRQVRAFRVSLSPIPNTSMDAALKTRLLEGYNNGIDKSDAEVSEMVIAYQRGDGGTVGEITFTDGFLVDGNVGWEIQSEGRPQSVSYTFEFANCDGYFVGGAFITGYPMNGDEDPEPEMRDGSQNAVSGHVQSDKRKRQRLSLKGTSGFRPLTTTGRQAVVPNWKTPLATNKWYS